MRATNRGRYFIAAAALVLAAGCAGVMYNLNSGNGPGSRGPADQGMREPIPLGDAAAGKQVFRFETFGNEAFWTDALRLPQGMVQQQVTPMQALELGLNVDVLKVPLDIALRVVGDLIVDPTLKSSKVMHDPHITVRLLNANAVIGFVPKDSNGDGRIDVDHGDKAGPTCALCHTIVKHPIFRLPVGGGIGFRDDGPANHDIRLGKIFATAANTRALYPDAQLSFKSLGGKTLGRAPAGLTEDSTEEEFDAYFSNPAYYPIGMFDDSLDGNGNPMHNMPFFRQDLAAPFGSEGTFARLEDFSNFVYTTLFDPTQITTPAGRAFLHRVAGAAGDELADGYVHVLDKTGVRGYPFVQAAPSPQAGTEAAFTGVRVEEKKLRDLNAYLVSLRAPPGRIQDEASALRGQNLFRTGVCVQCHNADQSRPVPANIIPMKTIFPGDDPVVIAPRDPPLTPVEDTKGSFFDDKMAVTNASLRGEKRGIAPPLLLDLARKPVFLHDNSVPSLDALFDPTRGRMAPHPFYFENPQDRKDIAEFLRGLDDREP